MKFLNLIYHVLFSLLVGIAMSMTFGVSPYAVAAGMIMLGAAYSIFTRDGRAKIRGLVLFSGLQVEMWGNHIENAIIEDDNHFLTLSKKPDAENVLGGKVVHIPQSGGAREVLKNPTNFPLSVVQRIDTDVIYALDMHVTKPIRVEHLAEKELSYDKRQSILEEDLLSIKLAVAEDTLYNWTHSPAISGYTGTTISSDQFLLTTGTDIILASAPGGTGNRKAARTKDLQYMRKKFKDDKRWFEGLMYAMLPEQMIIDLFPPESQTTALYMQAVSKQEREAGVIYKVQGWNIMSRSSVYTIDNSNLIKAPGAASETTDDEGALFWTPMAVEFVQGETKPMQDIDNPVWAGSIFNFLTRAGGRNRRADWKGVGVLQQAAE